MAITNIAYGDAQTRGRIRHWKKKLAERYVQFDQAFKTQAVGQTAIDMIRGSGLTRRHALDKLTRLLGPGVTFEKAELKKRNQGYALWSVLKPREGVAVIDAQTWLSEKEIGSLTQDCVSVNYIFAGLCNDGIRTARACGRLKFPIMPWDARSSAAAC